MFQGTNHVILHAEKYITQLTKKLGLSSMKSQSTPMIYGSPIKEPGDKELQDRTPSFSILGALSFGSNFCRPDVGLAVNLLARQSSTLTSRHLSLAKKLLK